MTAIQHMKNSVLKPLSMSQTISFQDAQDGSSFDVYAKEVLVQSSAGSHTTGSSKVKLKSIVDYGWESRHYPGRLVAIHMGGKYLAYGLKPVGKTVGVVRVVNRETDERVLIRDLLGLVNDLCFAHIRSQIMLASVDHFGNLFVHQIQRGANDNLDCSLVLHVEHEGNQVGSGLSHRVVWCPYIPEDTGGATVDAAAEDDAAKLLVVTHGAKAEMLNVARVRSDIPTGEVRVRPSHVLEGRLPMEEHSGDIVEASFSPDGTALATASTDGLVKFFQVYLPTEAKPRCLHEWRPHGGKPLSCLFFLDDHRNHSPEVQFWKFAITGTRNNHELKLWSCESWTCLQTIYFGDKEAPIGQEEGFLKAGLDLAAKFLLLSDIGKKVLYVLQFGRDEDEGISFVSTISEFHLPYPILSFGVVDAEICYNKCSSASPTAAYSDDPSGDVANEEGKGDTEENGGRRPAVEGEEAIQADSAADGSATIVIQIVLVQPKSLQECHIMFKSGTPNLSIPGQSSIVENPMPLDSSSGEAKMSSPEEMSMQSHSSVVGGSNQMNMQSDSLAGVTASSLGFSGVSNATILTLMTPDAFSSPIRREGMTPSGGVLVGSHPPSMGSSPSSTLSAPSSSGAPEKASPPPPSPHPDTRFPPPPPLTCSPMPTAAHSQDHPHIVRGTHAYVTKAGAEDGAAAPSQMSSVEKVDDVERGDQVEGSGVGGGSGGSSPSREVQQILSLSDSPRGVDREFFDDKEVEEEGAIVEGQDDEEDAMLPLTEQLDKVVVVVNQAERGRSVRNQKMEKSDLPECLDVHPPALEHLAVGVQSEENVADETAVETGVRQDGDGAGIGAEGRIGSGLASLVLEVGSLSRAIRAQGESLQRLRSEVKSELSSIRNECRWGGEGTSAVANLVESSLRPHLENSLDQSISHAMERVGPLIEVTLEDHRRELRLEHEKFYREGPSVCWDAVIRSAISDGLEPLRHQVGSEAAAQAETAAREGVSLALQRNSKMLVDNIANGLLVTLRPAMLETFRQAFAAVVLPSFEKSCSHMFQQINDAFSHGTKEYGRVVETHFERRWNSEKSKEAAAVESVRNEARQLAEAIREDVPTQIHKLTSSLGESLAHEVRIALEEPLSRGLREQRDWLEGNLTKSLQSIIFSPARVTPVGNEATKHLRGGTPTSSPAASPNGAILMRSRVSELAAQGRVNEAFQMALSASDLGLVTYLCELTNPAQVFGGSSSVGVGKCKLEQPVLLSLVQQLSANLYDHTELKMGYLVEAVFHLDMRQPELKEHLAMVLGVLQKGLNCYVASHPGSKLAKEMTMLIRTSACMLEFAKSQSASNSYGYHDPASVPLME